MGNKLLIIDSATSSRQARKRARELEFTNMRERYVTPLPLRKEFLKEERLAMKHACSCGEVPCL